MRHTHVAASLLLALAATSGAAAETVQQLTQPELQQITAWRRDLHEHPELSNREVRTAKLIAAELKKLGYDDEFMRKWEFFIAGWYAMFRSGQYNVMQAKLVHYPC